MDDTRAMHQDIRPIQILILKSDANKAKRQNFSCSDLWVHYTVAD